MNSSRSASYYTWGLQVNTGLVSGLWESLGSSTKSTLIVQKFLMGERDLCLQKQKEKLLLEQSKYQKIWGQAPLDHLPFEVLSLDSVFKSVPSTPVIAGILSVWKSPSLIISNQVKCLVEFFTSSFEYIYSLWLTLTVIIYFINNITATIYICL